MSLALIAIIFMVFLTVSYVLYGGWVARQFGLDNQRATPAHTHEDGVDFVPTKPFYLFAQHFSAIAAAGPIAGPIVACQQFGWLPCLLWISLGVVMIGAVHDFSTLALSVRHAGTSIADVTGNLLGKTAGRAMMAFIWIALLYIIVAFTDITAASFVSRPEEMAGLALEFHPGGAVAWASIGYMVISVIMGFVERFLKPPLWVLTVIFVPLTFATCWAGTFYSTWFLFDALTWGLMILAYCAIASVIPVWALLQPRGYLGGFVLYSALAIGVIGLFFGDYTIQQPAFTGLSPTSGGSLFPFLFVTIACGACSGFHGLVCSGTTSKQIDRECDIHSVGYGAMLAEAFVALIALAIIMMMAPSDVAGLKPGTIYGRGIGEFLTLIIGREHLPFAITFGAMAFSTFVFDTLDVSTRLGRYLIQELTGMKGRLGAILGTGLTLLIPGLILFTMQEGSWTKFWTLFGASNQLLAALSLLSITLWLHEQRKRIAFTLIPMLFVLAITFWALIEMTLTQWSASRGLDVSLLNSFASLALLLLAVYLVIMAIVKLRRV
ncbi:MAG: carbon starvation protein A [Bacteriovoracia bacterium]